MTVEEKAEEYTKERYDEDHHEAYCGFIAGYNMRDGESQSQSVGKDKNGTDVFIGDKYKVDACGDIYTVFMKYGCACGGLTFEKCVPLFMEAVDDEFEYVIPDWFELLPQKPKN